MSLPRPKPCPSNTELVELAEGQLDEAALARLKEHVAGCRVCAGVVAGLGAGELPAGRSPAVEAEIAWARHALAEGAHGRLLAPPHLLPAGSRLAGRFVIVSHAGSGGMGAVYRARDEQTGGTVALKLLQYGESPDVAERFAREARVLSELQHPGIVAYLAHGEAETGAPYLAMEWLDGEDLAQRLSRGPLPIAEALVLLRRAAEALAVAHERDLIHRDLKPSNLFLRGGQVDRLALLDFGIARRCTGSQVLTGTGVIVGTPNYMAPEQARGERTILAAVDVFSLGCVLFECIAGEPPFHAEHVMATLAKVLFEEAPRLQKVCPEAPEAVDVLLSRMLAKDPERRFKDASALLAALDALDANDALGPPPLPSPSALGGEQQLLSVLMAMPSSGSPATSSHDGGDPQTPATGVSDDTTAPLPLDESDVQELEGYGARIELLADGSLVATLLHTGAAAIDQATRAAQCAMRIKARWPEATIALGTGSGLLHDRGKAGEAFDRAAALLRDHAGGPGRSRIMVDEATRGLLEVRFVTEIY